MDFLLCERKRMREREEEGGRDREREGEKERERESLKELLTASALSVASSKVNRFSGCFLN